MNRLDRLERIAEQVRAGDSVSTEDREFLVAEVGRVLAGARKRGRKKDAPLKRALRRLKRAWVAEAIFRGDFPGHLVPAGRELEVKEAAGKRFEADDVAGSLVGASQSTVQKSRTGLTRRLPMDLEGWEEFKALMLFRASN